MIRKRKTDTSKIKTPKVYSADGFIFKSRDLLNFYHQLKDLKENSVIESFELPTVGDGVAKTKYGAKKCTIDNIKFDSIEESKFYIYLLGEQEAERIESFTMQPEFLLQEGFRKDGKAIRAISYIADFAVTYPDGEEIIYDVKGLETADFKIKKKMFQYKYREKTLTCVQYRASERRWMDLEDIKKLQREKKKSKAKENIA